MAMKNPTYLKAASEMKSAMLSMKSSRLAFSPQLYGTASVGKSGETLNDMTGNWSLGFEVSAPLFSGGETWYGYKKSEAAYRQAQHDEKTARQEVMKSLEESWNSLMDSVENVEVKKSSLEAYEERSRIGEVQYSIGSLTFDNWTIIENNLASARKSYIEA
jgi:outer membrane protein TolC